jgi:hypothetical protein
MHSKFIIHKMYRFLLLVMLFLFGCRPAEPKKDLVTNASTPKVENISKVLSPVEKPNENAFFQRKVLLQAKAEVLIPTVFNLMDAESISAKYPSKQSGDFEVYTNNDGNINIAFEHLPDKATMNDLPKLREFFEQQFNQPLIDFRKSEIKKINGRDFVVIEMVTPTADTEVYNLMFVTSSGGRLLMGTFNCTVDKQKEWQALAERILGSVKVRD